MTVYYAHTAPDGAPEERWQLLSDHLNAVSDRAGAFAAAFGAEPWGRLLGALHDAGKATPEFQSRLHGSSASFDHPAPGAKWLVERFPAMGPLLASAVAGHHVGVPNGRVADDREARETSNARHVEPLHDRLEGIPAVCPGFEELAASGDLRLEIPAESGLAALVAREDASRTAFAAYVLARMLHSCLVDADYLDTEMFVTPDKSEARDSWRHDELPVLRDKLMAHLDAVQSAAERTPVNAARRQVLDDAVAASKKDPGLFTFAAPTGSGKTLAALAFALNHAVQHGMDRVVVAIPFTSITSQTAAVYKEVLGRENVLEHHSNYDPCDLDEEQRLQERLAVQNWDAPVVVTTNVQLLESLFSNRPAKSRKIHSLANSVLVFDEAQSLPDHLLKASLATVEELVTGYGCSVVLCSATQPALEERWPFGSQTTEISRHRDGFDEAFGNRVEYQLMGEVTVGGIAEELAGRRQALAIVATKAQARELFDELRSLCMDQGLGAAGDPANAGLFHLSTNMTPEHRRAVIAEIRRRLATGEERCLVVSTSLIEAGVDVDFPEVFRQMAGMDSIVQSAGRCNREGRLPGKGTVHIFDLVEAAKDEGDKGATRRWSDKMAEIARQLIERHGDVGEELVPDFFRRRYDSEDLDTGVYGRPVFGALATPWQIEKRFWCMPFEQVAFDYQVIDEDSAPVLVPWDDAGLELLEQLEMSSSPASLAMRAQQHSVNVRTYELQKLRSERALIDIGPFSVLAPDLCGSYYRTDVGLSIGEEAAMAFIDK